MSDDRHGTTEVVFPDPAGTQKTVPGSWAGGDQWKGRYASPAVGTHRYRTRCRDTGKQVSKKCD